jgi:hypothetical protein
LWSSGADQEAAAKPAVPVEDGDGPRAEHEHRPARRVDCDVAGRERPTADTRRLEDTARHEPLVEREHDAVGAVDEVDLAVRVERQRSRLGGERALAGPQRREHAAGAHGAQEGSRRRRGARRGGAAQDLVGEGEHLQSPVSGIAREQDPPRRVEGDADRADDPSCRRAVAAGRGQQSRLPRSVEVPQLDLVAPRAQDRDEPAVDGELLG